MKLKEKRNRNNIFFTVAGIIIVLLLLAICLPVFALHNMMVERQEERRKNCIQFMSESIPLSAENYICENDDLLSHTRDIECDDEISEFTRSDLVYLYQDAIQVGTSTYSDVSSLFGEFEYYCPDEEERLNFETYRCSYGFFDMPTRVVHIFYDTENTVQDISSVSCTVLERAD